MEIGAGDGLQNTTRLLLEQGWTGTWVEGDPAQAETARSVFSSFVETGALRILSIRFSAENVNFELDRAGVEDTLDYVSVDVDHNTSHIWRALNRRARVCCIEYNASIPPSTAIEVLYDPEASWDGSNYFGAGLKVLEIIGRGKCLNLVGCDPQGVNGYFVSDDAVGDRFRQPFTAENHYKLPCYDFVGHVGHPPSRIARRWTAAFEADDFELR